MIIEYKIYPAVTNDGTPTYYLFKESKYSKSDIDIMDLFGIYKCRIISSIRIAENADRSVLEKAIEHLNNESI